jgi:hypothetical protein
VNGVHHRCLLGVSTAGKRPLRQGQRSCAGGMVEICSRPPGRRRRWGLWSGTQIAFSCWTGAVTATGRRGRGTGVELHLNIIAASCDSEKNGTAEPRFDEIERLVSAVLEAFRR